MKHYLLTIRKHQVKDYVSPEDIRDAILYLKLKHDSLHVNHEGYELDPYLQLHWHGWVTSKYPIIYKDNSKYRGFRLYWRRITEDYNIVEYILKHPQNANAREQLFAENYYTHNYGFPLKMEQI